MRTMENSASHKPPVIVDIDLSPAACNNPEALDHFFAGIMCAQWRELGTKGRTMQVRKLSSGWRRHSMSIPFAHVHKWLWFVLEILWFSARGNSSFWEDNARIRTVYNRTIFRNFTPLQYYRELKFAEKLECMTPVFDREATNDDATNDDAVKKLGRVREAGGCDVRIKKNKVSMLRAKMSSTAQNELNEGLKALNRRNSAYTTPVAFNTVVWRSGGIV